MEYTQPRTFPRRSSRTRSFVRRSSYQEKRLQDCFSTFRSTLKEYPTLASLVSSYHDEIDIRLAEYQSVRRQLKEELGSDNDTKRVVSGIAKELGLVPEFCAARLVELREKGGGEDRFVLQRIMEEVKGVDGVVLRRWDRFLSHNEEITERRRKGFRANFSVPQRRLFISFLVISPLVLYGLKLFFVRKSLRIATYGAKLDLEDAYRDVNIAVSGIQQLDASVKPVQVLSWGLPRTPHSGTEYYYSTTREKLREYHDDLQDEMELYQVNNLPLSSDLSVSISVLIRNVKELYQPTSTIRERFRKFAIGAELPLVKAAETLLEISEALCEFEKYPARMAMNRDMGKPAKKTVNEAQKYIYQKEIEVDELKTHHCIQSQSIFTLKDKCKIAKTLQGMLLKAQANLDVIDSHFEFYEDHDDFDHPTNAIKRLPAIGQGLRTKAEILLSLVHRMEDDWDFTKGRAQLDIQLNETKYLYYELVGRDTEVYARRWEKIMKDSALKMAVGFKKQRVFNT